VFSNYSLGDIVHGYVSNTDKKKGCFIKLSKDITARVLFSNLSDAFIKDVERVFRRGKLVMGKIIQLDPDTSRLELSLKGSAVTVSDKLGFDQLSVGQSVQGTIKKIQDFGIFITLQNSDLVGLCHLSEVSDDYVKDIKKLSYNEGDNVKVKILGLDKSKKRIALGLKPSYFKDEMDVEEEEEDDGKSDDGSGDESELDEEDLEKKLKMIGASDSEE
jgi:rRNA biogenesis protein RRP5